MLGLSGVLPAAISVLSVSLSNSNPAPGAVVTVTVQYCAGQWDDPFWLLAVRPVANTSLASCPTTGQSFLVYGSVTNGVPPSSSPSVGWDSGVQESSLGCPTRTQVFNVTIPGSLTPGNTYNLIAAAGSYWADCGTFDSRAWASFTLGPPGAASASLLKRVEGTASNGELMLYWLDYDVFNATNLSVRDTLPACASFLDAAPQPANGLPASVSAGTVQWALPDADAAAPDPYRRVGSLWVLVRLGGCPGQVCNTGEISTSGTGGWQPSNTVCQALGQANVQLLKSQLDLAGNPVSSVANGTQIQYVLQYQFSGSGLKCYDSFQSYALNANWQNTGGLAATNPSGGSWIIPAGDPGNVGWHIISGSSPGEQIVQYNCNTAACITHYYRVLLYDCPTAKPNGEDFCGGMVESDVRIDGNASNGDTGLVIRTDNAGNGYLAVLTVDPYPGAAQAGGVGGHFQIQKNTLGNPCWNGQCSNPSNAACPASMGVVMPPALAPQYGIWYTIKVLEQPMGHFYAKYWKRGTPEPTGWLLDWNDNSGCNGPLHDCSVADGNPYRPGIAGQADLMSYDNFRLYSAASLSGAQLWDSVPAGIDYVSASPAPNGLTPANNNAPGDMVRWDFSGSNFGAVGGLLYEGTGSFTWVGQADCSESVTALNRASLGAAVPAIVNQSNQVALGISGCNSPTVTPTRSPTATASPSRTASPTVTPTATATASPSATASATPTASPSATPSASPSATVTPSVTPSPSPTASPTGTWSVTESPTISNSPSATQTPSATATASPSPTATPSASPTLVFSATPSGTPTATPSLSPSFSPSPSATASATASPTPSASPTASDSPTSSPSATPSPSASASPTATASATATVSPTVTPSASPTATPSFSPTISPTFSVSPTASPSPIPLPQQLSLAVYNSAGERVRLLYDGPAQLQPQALQLSTRSLLSGAAPLLISLPGQLSGGATQILWPADNDAGQPVDGGAYTVKAELRDPFGQVSSLVEPLQVLPAGLQQALRIYNSAGELARQLTLSAAVDGAARLLTDGDSFLLQPGPTGAALQPFKIEVQGRGGSSLQSWDGLSAQGAPVAEGVYTVQLISLQGGRETVVATRSLAVLKAPEDAGLLDSLRLGPNPARPGQTVWLCYDPSRLRGGRAEAEVFDLLGQRVRGAADPGASGRLDLGLGRDRAPGIYLVRFQCRQGGLVLRSRLLKLALLH